MERKRESKRTIMILITLLGIMVVLLSLKTCSLQRENEELVLLNQMLQDKEELSCLYESGDFTSEDWLRRYREIGLRFMNYLCEYEGEKEEVKALIEKYRQYGEKILEISGAIETGKLEEAKKELEEVKALADEIETSMEKVYEEVH